MTTLSLREAAEQTGVSKSTIFRAIKGGRMSAPRDADGNFAIDPAELFRVYPPKADVEESHTGTRDVPVTPATRPEVQGAPDPDTVELRVRNAALEAEIRGLREMADELRRTRDAWQAQAERATLALSAPQNGGEAGVSKSAQPPAPSWGAWWPFRRAI